MSRKRYETVLALFMVLLFSQAVYAGRDDFPTCMKLIDAKVRENSPPERELFIILDQTFVIDTALKKKIHSKIHRFIKPGDRLTLLTFSAYVNDRYASMPLSGQLDKQLSSQQRRHTSIPKLKKFDACLEKQKSYVHKMIDQKLKKAFSQASNDLPKTELTGSLAHFGETVIARSKAGKKYVLLISDMLENSDIVSFYRRGKVIAIDVDKAIEKLDKSGRLKDWDNAKVFVTGAAYTDSGQYRSESVLTNLRRFWEDFFSKSHATLIEWGQPELMNDIR